MQSAKSDFFPLKDDSVFQYLHTFFFKYAKKRKNSGQLSRSLLWFVILNQMAACCSSTTDRTNMVAAEADSQLSYHFHTPKTCGRPTHRVYLTQLTVTDSV